MGSSSSKQKPEDPSAPPPAQDLFKDANAPIIFSSRLISHLESTKESNSTRAAELESHIQSRVRDELARLQALSEERQQKVLEAMKQQGLEIEKEATGLSSITLEGDIKELKDKWGGWRESKQDQEARKAETELRRCLLLNERQPLDCWWEVKQFKDKVAKLEREFVLKNQ